MRPRRLAALVPLLLAAVATRAQDFRCPDRGGPAWREIRSAHVLLQTDLPSGKAQDLARELERMYQVVRHGLFRTPPPPAGALRVVAFRSEDEYRLFAQRNVAAHYRAGDDSGPVIVMPGVFAEAQRIVVAHELTHHVTAQVFARQPRWFSEGLAGFMETVGSSGPDNTPTLGGVPRYLYARAFPYHGGAGKVLLASDLVDDTGRQYAVAWALVHFLVNRHPQEFGQLQARFGRGQDPAVAWREVFPRWDPASKDGAEALDREIGGYLGRGKFGYRDVLLPPTQPVVERPMTAAEAHAVRLTLPWVNQGEKVEPSRIRAEVDEALAHDPGHVAALALLAAQASPAERLRLAERASTAHPEDPLAWLLLGRAIPEAEGERRIEAFRKAVGGDAASATALNELAWALLGAGRSGEALPLARKAAGLEPWGSPVLDTYSGVLEDLGQCADALAVQRRAVDVLSERGGEKERAPYLERLARLERSCGQAARDHPPRREDVRHGSPSARPRARPPGQPRPPDPDFRVTPTTARRAPWVMAKRTVKVQRARVDRGGDVGIDLPAGTAASELRPSDYHPVEMEPPEHVVHGAKTHAAEVERPGDVGMDLPAGATAGELKPADYHPVDMEPPPGRKHAHRR